MPAIFYDFMRNSYLCALRQAYYFEQTNYEMKKKCDCIVYYFPVFSFLFIGIGSVLLSVFMFSCSSSVKNPLLLCADTLMETRPDSALTILESISSPQKLSSADRAFYALLLTQARHKNYITLDDDSLIKTAVEYYGDKKKSLNAAKAHYYLGATYRDMGRTAFAVEEYLAAIRLMPVKNEFLAMIYENLAGCYEDDNLYDIAMGAYRKAYSLRKNGTKQIFPLRGIAYTFLLQNQLDSALYYYQKALDNAFEVQDSNWISVLNHDFAMVYERNKDYDQAYKRISQAVSMLGSDKAANVFRTKGRIMFGLNEIDSAHYYFNKYKEDSDIYGKAICYSMLYQIEKAKGNWKEAVRDADSYMVLYDSIQGMSDSKELARLMDNYKLEEHKKELSQHAKIIVISLVTSFIVLVVVASFWFLWKDRKRKAYYIALQEELKQKRLDVMQLKDTPEFKEECANDKLKDLINQQLGICISLFQTTDSYEKLKIMEQANPKQVLAIRKFIPSINKTIESTFIDVVENLRECCPQLTPEDLYYCILSLIRCSKNTIVELMKVTPNALKTRKNRIKNKIKLELFEFIFIYDNQ